MKFLSTFSDLKYYPDDMNMPLSQKALNKLIGRIEAKEAHQTTATDATLHIWMADFDGQLADAYTQMGTLPAGAGESQSVDLHKNGVSILSAPVIFDGTYTAGKVYDLLQYIAKANRSFVKGDVFTMVIDYTAGGGPTPGTDTKVVIEPSAGPWKE